MTLKDKIKKHKDKPVSIIFYASSYLGIELAKVLIDQGSLVIAIDSVENQNLEAYQGLIENDNFVLIDCLGLNSLKTVLERLDYSFYFSRVINKTKVGAKKFQEEIAILEDGMNLSLDKEAKFLLIDSIDIHRKAISDSNSKKTTKTQKSYTITEQQIYYEKLVLEYIDKYNLQASIVRMGRVYGPEMQFEADDRLSKLIIESITKDKIVITGDGLCEYYFVYISDAVYALLKSQFSADSKGKILSCKDEAETTELGIVYALIEQGYRAKEVSFIDKDIEQLEKDDTESLGVIGWSPKVSLPRGLKIVVDEYIEKSGNKISDINQENPEQEQEIQIKSAQKNESESIMEVMSASYKKDALDSSVKQKSDDKRLKRVFGIKSKKKDENQDIKVKAQKRKDKTTSKGKLKTMMKVFSVILFFAIYLFFFAPLIKASFNTLLSNRLFNSLEYNINHNETEDAISTIDSLQTSLESQQKSLESLNRINFKSYLPLERFFATDSELNSMLQILEDIKNSLEYEELISTYALGSSFSLSNSIDPNNDTESIEITQKGLVDDSGLVQNPLEVLEDYNTKLAELKALNSSKIKSDLLFDKLIINKLESVSNNYRLGEAFLGFGGESNTMIILIDDTDTTILGGDPRAYAIINIIDSKLSSIEVNNIESDSSDLEEAVSEVEADQDRPETTETSTTEETVEQSAINYEKYELSLDNLISDIVSQNKPKNIDNVDNVLVINESNLEKIIKELGSIELDESTITDKNLDDYLKDENYDGLLRALIIKVVTLDPKSRNDIIKFIYSDIQNGEIILSSPLRDLIIDQRRLKTNEIKILSSELPIVEYKGEKLEKERFLEIEVQDNSFIVKYTLDFKIDDKPSFQRLVSFRLPKNATLKATKGLENPTTTNSDSEVVVTGLVVGDNDKTMASCELNFEIPFAGNNHLFAIENTPSSNFDQISVTVKQNEVLSYESDILVKTDSALSTTRKFLGTLNFELSL